MRSGFPVVRRERELKVKTLGYLCPEFISSGKLSSQPGLDVSTLVISTSNIMLPAQVDQENVSRITIATTLGLPGRSETG